MNNWVSERFCDVCEQIPVNKKYSKEQVQNNGNIKVLDQSQSDIFGWHNNSADINASPQSPVFTFANHTCFMRWMEEPFSLIQNVFPLRGIPGKTDTRFLYYASGALVVQEGYKGHFPKLKESMIKIPPLPEQKKIAEIIYSFEKQLSCINKLISSEKLKYRALLENIFNAYLIDKKIALENAESLCSKITKGTTPPSGNEMSNKDIPFLRVNNIDFNGYINPNQNFLKISQETHEGFLSRSICIPGDILINIVGPPLGKIGLVTECIGECNINQALVVFRLNPNVDRDYFLNFLKSNIVQKWFDSQSKRTSGQQNLTIEICKNLKIPLPDIAKQHDTSRMFNSIQKYIFNLETKRTKMINLKKAVSFDLISGRKRVKV